MISLIGMKLCMHTHTKKLKVQALMYLVFNNNKKKDLWDWFTASSPKSK